MEIEEDRFEKEELNRGGKRKERTFERRHLVVGKMEENRIAGTIKGRHPAVKKSSYFHTFISSVELVPSFCTLWYFLMQNLCNKIALISSISRSTMVGLVPKITLICLFLDNCFR